MAPAPCDLRNRWIERCHSGELQRVDPRTHRREPLYSDYEIQEGLSEDIYPRKDGSDGDSVLDVPNCHARSASGCWRRETGIRYQLPTLRLGFHASRSLHLPDSGWNSIHDIIHTHCSELYPDLQARQAARPQYHGNGKQGLPGTTAAAAAAAADGKAKKRTRTEKNTQAHETRHNNHQKPPLCYLWVFLVCSSIYSIALRDDVRDIPRTHPARVVVPRTCACLRQLLEPNHLRAQASKF